MSIHINAEKEDIAKIVIMPGDPLRAKYIAENYLENYKLINKVRNNLGYTGTYNNKKVTVISSGMGMPSMAIYATELYNEYDVDKIIRVGSCGSYLEAIDVYSIILAEKAFTLSNFSYQHSKEEINIAKSSQFLNQKIINTAYRNNIDIKIGNVNTSDLYYPAKEDEKISLNYCLAVEMECFALFYLATKFKKEATAVLTVSNNLVTKKEINAEEKETKFNDSIKLVLESI